MTDDRPMCERLAETLSSYFDGELTEAEAEKLIKHLAGCPACRRRLEEYKLIDRLAGSEVPKLPTDIASIIMDMIERDYLLGEFTSPDAVKKARLRRIVNLFAVAALLSVLIATVFVLVEFGRSGRKMYTEGGVYSKDTFQKGYLSSRKNISVEERYTSAEEDKKGKIRQDQLAVGYKEDFESIPDIARPYKDGIEKGEDKGLESVGKNKLAGEDIDREDKKGKESVSESISVGNINVGRGPSYPTTQPSGISEDTFCKRPDSLISLRIPQIKIRASLPVLMYVKDSFIKILQQAEIKEISHSDLILLSKKILTGRPFYQKLSRDLFCCEDGLYVAFIVYADLHTLQKIIDSMPSFLQSRFEVGFNKYAKMLDKGLYLADVDFVSDLLRWIDSQGMNITSLPTSLPITTAATTTSSSAAEGSCGSIPALFVFYMDKADTEGIGDTASSFKSSSVDEDDWDSGNGNTHDVIRGMPDNTKDTHRDRDSSYDNHDNYDNSDKISDGNRDRDRDNRIDDGSDSGFEKRTENRAKSRAANRIDNNRVDYGDSKRGGEDNDIDGVGDKGSIYKDSSYMGGSLRERQLAGGHVDRTLSRASGSIQHSESPLCIRERVALMLLELAERNFNNVFPLKGKF